MKKIAVILLLCISIFSEMTAADKTAAKKTGNDYVKVKAYPSYDKITLGYSIWVAFTFTIEKDWHVYWKNPGDAGLPTTFKFDLPKGFKLNTVHWPNPKSFPFSNMVNYGYENEFTVIASILIEPGTPFGKYTIGTDISWLACKEECLPGKASTKVSIEISDKILSNNEYLEKYETLEMYPLDYDSTLCKARIEGNKLFMKITMPPYFVPDNNFKFFPLEQGIFVLAAKQPAKVEGNFLEIELALDPNREKNPETFNGLLVGEKPLVSKNDYTSFYLFAKVVK